MARLIYLPFGRCEGGLYAKHWPNNHNHAWRTTIGGQEMLIQDWVRSPSFPALVPPEISLTLPLPLPHQQYSIGFFLRIPEKTRLALSVLRPTPSSSSSLPESSGPPDLPFRISYCSAATIPGALPLTVARGFGFPWFFGFKGVNENVFQGLLRRGVEELPSERAGEEKEDELEKDKEKQREGEGGGLVLLLDYWEFPGGLVELLVAMNFSPRRR